MDDAADAQIAQIAQIRQLYGDIHLLAIRRYRALPPAQKLIVAEHRSRLVGRHRLFGVHDPAVPRRLRSIVQHTAEVDAEAELPTEPDGLAHAFVHRSWGPRPPLTRYATPTRSPTLKSEEPAKGTPSIGPDHLA